MHKNIQTFVDFQLLYKIVMKVSIVVMENNHNSSLNVGCIWSLTIKSSLKSSHYDVVGCTGTAAVLELCSPGVK